MAVVDDEFLAVDRLRRLCRRLAGVEVAGVAADTREAQALVDTQSIDVLLLDIGMPGLDGLSWARELVRRKGTVPALVFVTAHADFAVDAFELAATDYLLKPVSQHRLERALARATERTRPLIVSPAKLDWWVPRNGELTRLPAEEIDWIEADRDYLRIYARGRSFLLRATMSAAEQALDPEAFLRVHRSMIVQCDRIAALCHHERNKALRLQDGRIVKIGRTYLQTVCRRFDKLALTQKTMPLASR